MFFLYFQVHFHPSALYCVGNKKFIKKNAVPSFFCKCDVKRKPLAEIQSKECNKLIESLPHKNIFSRNDYTYFFQSMHENKTRK